jgi:methylated-DNA-[protein]-cysteine S-methyltransferase
MSRGPCQYKTFDTAIGKCAIAWHENGILRLQLPEESSAETVAKLGQRFQESLDNVPDFVQQTINKLQRYLSGQAQDFSNVKLDLSYTPQFHKRVYEALRLIRAGEIVSYAELAKRAGSPLASRAVGQAMARNPLPILIPCHRVLNSSGKLGGFSAYGGTDTKAKLLSLEKTANGSRVYA